MAVTAVNLFFDLARVVMITDDCSVRVALARVRAFLLADARQVLGVFGAMGGIVLLATAATFTATAGLALVAWVPLVGLLFVPLQLAFWIVRGLLFQYMSLHDSVGLSKSVSTVLGAGPGADPLAGSRSMTNYDPFFSQAASQMRESAIRQMGTVLAQAKDMISFAPGYPAEDQFPWQLLTEIARDLLDGHDGSVLQYGPTQGYRPLREATVEPDAGAAHRRARPSRW